MCNWAKPGEREPGKRTTRGRREVLVTGVSWQPEQKCSLITLTIILAAVARLLRPPVAVVVGVVVGIVVGVAVVTVAAVVAVVLFLALATK